MKEEEKKMKKITKILTFTLAVIICLSTMLCVSPLAAENTVKKAEITKICAKSSSIKLVWNKVPQAETYTVYRWSVGSDEGEKVRRTKKTYFFDKDIIPDEEYYYSIAYKSGDKEIFGEIKSFCFLYAPKIKSVKKTGDGIKISWGKVSSADSYIVYRISSDGSYKKIATLKGSDTLSYTDKKVKDCAEYRYALRSAKGGYKSAYSSESEKATFIRAPKIISVKNSPKGVTVTWKKNTAPTSYYIYRKAGSGKWKKAGEVLSGKNTFTDKKAAYGKICTYKLRAVKKGETSLYSEALSLRALDPKKPAIALTWDDGPYTPVTNKILDCLEKYNGRGTFFVVGSRVETYKDCIKREAALGCEIGCHTYSHANLTRLSSAEIKKEINSSVKAIEKYSGGQKVRLVRTPGGAVNDKVKAAVKYPLINWSVDTLDWQHRTTSKTVANIKQNAKDGSIVLMHDLYYATGDAAVEIIPWLTSKGYQLVTVSELFDLKGVNAQKGSLYTHG